PQYHDPNLPLTSHLHVPFPFFFYRYPHLPHLHSFPTRRSSDLISYYAEPVRQGMTMGELAEFFNGEKHLGASVTVIKMAGWHRRSEEHTSELQSRENLVCRLLLEKKKNKQVQYTNNICKYR